MRAECFLLGRANVSRSLSTYDHCSRKLHVAVSNMPVEREEKIEGGKEVRFSMSPPMSSYLVVLVAGELDSIEMESNGVQLRVVATKGKRRPGVTRSRARRKFSNITMTTSAFPTRFRSSI